MRGRGELLDTVVEVESGRKGSKGRPELARALALCKTTESALVIGKLDRLSRDVRFFLEVIDDSKIDIHFADFPDVRPASSEGRMILVSMANFAELEAWRIGERTKAALVAAKARGVKLGTSGAVNIRPNIEERRATANIVAGKLSGLFAGFKARGMSQRQMVAELNTIDVKMTRGSEWRLSQVQRVLARLPA